MSVATVHHPDLRIMDHKNTSFNKNIGKRFENNNNRYIYKKKRNNWSKPNVDQSVS